MVRTPGPLVSFCFAVGAPGPVRPILAVAAVSYAYALGGYFFRMNPYCYSLFSTSGSICSRSAMCISLPRRLFAEAARFWARGFQRRGRGLGFFCVLLASFRGRSP